MDNFIFLPDRSKVSAGNSATGKLSVALGQHCTASGEYSLADGSGCIASTTCSVALGNAADASGTCGFMYKDICDNTFCFDSGGQNGNTAHIKINGNVVASGGGGGSRGGMVTIDGNSAETAYMHWDAVPELKNLHPSTAVKITLIGPGGAGGNGIPCDPENQNNCSSTTGGGGGGGGGVIFWTDASTARGYRPDLDYLNTNSAVGMNTNLYSTGTSADAENTQVRGYPGTTMDRQQLLVAYRGGDGAAITPGPGGGVSGSWIPPYAHRPRDDPIYQQPAIMSNVFSATGEDGEPGVSYNPVNPAGATGGRPGGDSVFGGSQYGRGGKGDGGTSGPHAAKGGCIIIEWFS